MQNIFLFIPLIALLFISMVTWVFPELYAVRKKTEGDHVAEIWLDWGIGRGSTLYRQRFKTERGAYRAVRLRALLLDWALPTHYGATNWSGRRYFEKHEYALQWGIRQISPQECDEFRQIWSPSLPGDRYFSGEAAAMHPMLTPLDLKDLNEVSDKPLST